MLRVAVLIIFIGTLAGALMPSGPAPPDDDRRQASQVSSLEQSEGETQAVEPATEAHREERPAKGRGRSKAKAEAKPQPEPVSATPARTPEPIREDKGGWNGPVPGFLQFSAA